MVIHDWGKLSKTAFCSVGSHYLLRLPYVVWHSFFHLGKLTLYAFQVTSCICLLNHCRVTHSSAFTVLPVIYRHDIDHIHMLMLARLVTRQGTPMLDIIQDRNHVLRETEAIGLLVSIPTLGYWLVPTLPSTPYLATCVTSRYGRQAHRLNLMSF